MNAQQPCGPQRTQKFLLSLKSQPVSSLLKNSGGVVTGINNMERYFRTLNVRGAAVRRQKALVVIVTRNDRIDRKGYNNAI